MKIIYDATSMLEGEFAPVFRTGIYTVSVNVFKELYKRDDIELAFWSRPQFVAVEKKILKDRFDVSEPILVNRVGKLCSFFSRLWYGNECARLKRKKGNIYYARCVIRNILQGFINLTDKGIIDEVEDHDCFLSPNNQAPERILRCEGIKKAIFINDVIAYIFPECFPKFHEPSTKHWLKDLINTADNSELFIAISECTKKDFLKVCSNIDDQNVAVVPLACSKKYQKKTEVSELVRVRKKYGIPDKKYVFSLCSIEPRKNLIRQIETFATFIKENDIRDLVFVMGGNAWNSFEGEFHDRLKKIDNLNDFLCLAGYVAEEDLPYLYSGAEWFVYTSQYEGFGLPPLEAMACGCPVIVSNSSSLPEVVGDAGIKITWDSDEEHVEAFGKYYFDTSYRELMADKALKRAQEFGWDVTVDGLLEKMT